MKLLLSLFLAVSVFGEATTSGETASWYGEPFHGRKMANGQTFDMHAMTCAATKTYRLGDRLTVRNRANDKRITVTVTDRGGFEKYGRQIDLSRGAFSAIADLKTGVIEISIEKH